MATLHKNKFGAIPAVAVIPVGDDVADKALEISYLLRRAGYRVEQSYSGNIKKRMIKANKVNAYKAVILGSEEIANNVVTLKDLDDMKTVGYYSTGKATEPPVGYLICTKGDDYGTGFLLKSGNNTIGRSASMDVVVMDMKVSREKQAFVMYEPHKREFYVKPGEGSGLCYFNGDVVLGPMKMNAYDKIGVGDTELMLIPVCTQEFSWDDL